MKKQEVKFKNSKNNYSVLIGDNLINLIPNKIKLLCPNTKQIALIIDKKIPNKFKKVFQKKLRGYKLLFISFEANEKSKSINTVNSLLQKLLLKNFNRSDLVIAVGGGITGDVVGFTASILKRGVNFINIPTTLLAQVDSAIGGKTGINSLHGKNLVGTFYQPKLVVCDTSFLNSLPKKEMICGFAEILKHSIIKDKKFFKWLKNNSKGILLKNLKKLSYAIKKSCEIKMYFVNKDVNEKGLRMALNFGHTFAHAIEANSKYSKSITHGEAVLSGMILATRLSVIRKVCNLKTLRDIEEIYRQNNLTGTYKQFSNIKLIKSLIPFLKNDKKNNDNKINFILIKKIGKTADPYKHKISEESLRKYFLAISRY